jgi:uncharacterized RDD family membrane protein YckC
MKCPKCGYLRFEHVDRCRYCGYDFSLSAVEPEPDLPIRTHSGATPSTTELSMLDVKLAPPPPPSPELPFGDAMRTDGSDDEPPISRPSRPRPPLAVRRATPEVPRLRGQSLTPSLNFAAEPAKPSPVGGGRSGEDEAVTPAAPEISENATAFARLAAVVVDLLILAAVDAAVIYFTLRICGISMAEIDILPKGPLVAFILVQNVGYLVAFTAGGQTLGKMALGIRVVQAGSDDPLDIGHAVLRTIVWLALAVPAGLGFLTAIPGRDHRGLHDRFAGTRVVRV